ncbi:unnamed protein product [Heterobilharzia americana]|nr:unnamed protein product [Heterobilharzia americana]
MNLPSTSEIQSTQPAKQTLPEQPETQQQKPISSQPQSILFPQQTLTQQPSQLPQTQPTVTPTSQGRSSVPLSDFSQTNQLPDMKNLLVSPQLQTLEQQQMVLQQPSQQPVQQAIPSSATVISTVPQTILTISSVGDHDWNYNNVRAQGSQRRDSKTLQ